MTSVGSVVIAGEGAPADAAFVFYLHESSAPYSVSRPALDEPPTETRVDKHHLHIDGHVPKDRLRLAIQPADHLDSDTDCEQGTTPEDQVIHTNLFPDGPSGPAIASTRNCHYYAGQVPPAALISAAGYYRLDLTNVRARDLPTDSATAAYTPRLTHSSFSEPVTHATGRSVTGLIDRSVLAPLDEAEHIFDLGHEEFIQRVDRLINLSELVEQADQQSTDATFPEGDDADRILVTFPILESLQQDWH